MPGLSSAFGFHGFSSQGMRYCVVKFLHITSVIGHRALVSGTHLSTVCLCVCVCVSTLDPHNG